MALGLGSIVTDNTIIFIMGLVLRTWEPQIGMLLALQAGFTAYCNVCLMW